MMSLTTVVRVTPPPAYAWSSAMARASECNSALVIGSASPMVGPSVPTDAPVSPGGCGPLGGQCSFTLYGVGGASGMRPTAERLPHDGTVACDLVTGSAGAVGTVCPPAP